MDATVIVVKWSDTSKDIAQIKTPTWLLYQWTNYLLCMK